MVFHRNVSPVILIDWRLGRDGKVGSTRADYQPLSIQRSQPA